MKRVKGIVTYDGTKYSGYQVQVDKKTIQAELEKALAKIHKADSWNVVSSGRTDTGVHSLGQTIHFDTSLSIPEERWPQAFNRLLPDDIQVRDLQYVHHDFHARFDSVGKKYVYKVNTAREKDIFKRNFVYHHPYVLSYEKMLEAAMHLEGTHDFTSFSSPRTDVIDKVRTIYAIELEKNGDEWTFTYIGNGFLYQMVRVLTGTLLHVGKGKIRPEEIPEIFEGKDRSLAGPSIPGTGLYLTNVYYDQEALEVAVKNLKHS
ncbi:tRNA pseudouridine(38-40) synthase TruA [Evansella cellulosilytica]|uniref:tRNA pseudouridine synthase A n=1 Tax=Evansella cellulosilytica (strain ATCC 21833 / DSM 2522 / FERM P-1141 / JCM 9156 / N-4) TaxID=649639 RepID=E6TTA5_EVAC2|nr:tRNA pseudouridine(38-40) synthase TruA [Evansella cellulosilytica]ADU28445.1 tRNA pseudouridine synthase A [Evansella cellulosilytica DSM 2522]